MHSGGGRIGGRDSPRRSGWTTGALAALGLASACGTPGSSSTDSGDEPFYAFASDFHGYHSWKSFDVTGGAALAGIHDGSTVTEYVKRLPPHGSTTFPVGTIIIKEATGGTDPHELFAMVKRGGGYNPGAPGWEWFDLQQLTDGTDSVQIIWQGFTPPAGDTYGGSTTAGCNTCHTDCGNDAVCAKPLQLSNF